MLQIVKLLDPIQMSINGTFTPKGAYNASTDYSVGDQVDYQGSSYIMYNDAAAGTVPTNTSYWGLVASKGDAGADGADSTVPGPAGTNGTDGTDGKTILNGTIDPTTEGVDGDFYINTTSDQIFGPKTAGVWGTGTSIVGPAGADGADGQGVPIGGTTGQVLAKTSNTDFDTYWKDDAGISDPGSNGILARTALNTTTSRTITGTANQITVTNGDGVSGNPTLSLPQDIHTGASPTFAGGTLNGTLTGRTINPSSDSLYDFGSSTNYYRYGYTDRLYLNSTAYLDGGTAGTVNISGEIGANTTQIPVTSGDYIVHSFVGRADVTGGSPHGGFFQMISNIKNGGTGTWLVGAKFNSILQGEAGHGNVSRLIGGVFVAETQGSYTATVAEAIGFEGYVYKSSTSTTITEAIAVSAKSMDGAGNTAGVTNQIGVKIGSQIRGSATNIGLNILDIYGATSNFAIRTRRGDVVINEDGATDADLRVEGDTDQNLLFTDASADKVGIGTNAPTSKLDINSDNVRIRTAKTPTSATDTGTQGQVCWDANYIYVCTATNTWKRSAIATW